MTALRKLAKGQQCQVRIPGCCNFNPETTVLAHVRMAGLTGIGQKAHDIHASWCCSACHEVVDGRSRAVGLTAEEVHSCFLEGVLRTQAQLIKLGRIKV